jgi:hypothetical protein
VNVVAQATVQNPRLVAAIYQSGVRPQHLHGR